MKVSVWDTYVPRENGTVMHFDILVPSEVVNAKTIFGFGANYLKAKAFKTGELTSKECRFCHMENAPDEVISSIEKQGYHIIEMENCL